MTLRNTIASSALAAMVALPAYAANPTIPESTVWSAYDLGSA